MSSQIKKVDSKTIITGIVCKTCKIVLQAHTVGQHLDPDHEVHKCPHSFSNPNVCNVCMLTECCCEADRLQVIADDKRATDAGYREVDGKWIKMKRSKKN